MPENELRDLIPSSGGILQDLMQRIKLILRLMADERVSPLVKAIPLGAVVYFFFFPDLAVGPVDDAAVLWLGMYLFVELCPPEVVEEHQARLAAGKPSTTWSDAGVEGQKDDDVVDGEFREM